MFMSTEDVIKGVIGGFGGAIGIWEFFHHIRMRRHRKKVLRGLLEDNPKYSFGRTFRILKTAVACDAKTTEEILRDIGARPEVPPKGQPAKDPDDVLWTLKPLP